MILFLSLGSFVSIQLLSSISFLLLSCSPTLELEYDSASIWPLRRPTILKLYLKVRSFGNNSFLHVFTTSSPCSFTASFRALSQSYSPNPDREVYHGWWYYFCHLCHLPSCFDRSASNSDDKYSQNVVYYSNGMSSLITFFFLYHISALCLSWCVTVVCVSLDGCIIYQSLASGSDIWASSA